MRRVKKAPATRIDGVQHFCIELNSCEDNDFYASGTFLLYLNCCIVLCPVLCTLYSLKCMLKFYDNCPFQNIVQ